jgi:glycosyltransferase involved in cell wall biosynthesis
MIKLLIDGVFYQLNNTGIARLWTILLQNLASSNKFDIYLLNRGNLPTIKGIKYINFIQYDINKPELDSLMIQKVCDELDIDLFSSTYYTTPTKTPTLLIIYDMIPEVFKFDMTNTMWIEKGNAISYAQKYICISENTKKDLLNYYPEIPSDRVDTCYCGVEEDIFFQHQDNEINKFIAKHSLKRNYFILVGNRGDINNYKNCYIFFKSISTIINFNADILCVGGNINLENYIIENLPYNSKCIRLDLNDYELSIAYSGALALIYPSLYEGFGLPVIESMASGCPVITTHKGSLLEVASDSAYIISGNCVLEMQKAVINIQNYKLRCLLKAKGFDHIKKFSWHEFSNCVSHNLLKLYEESNLGIYTVFFDLWNKSRLKSAKNKTY